MRSEKHLVQVRTRYVEPSRSRARCQQKLLVLEAARFGRDDACADVKGGRRRVEQDFDAVIGIERLRLGERRVDLTAQVALRQRGAMIGEDALGGQQRDLPAAAALAIGLDRPCGRQSAADDNELELLHRVPPLIAHIPFLGTCVSRALGSLRVR